MGNMLRQVVAPLHQLSLARDPFLSVSHASTLLLQLIGHARLATHRVQTKVEWPKHLNELFVKLAKFEHITHFSTDIAKYVGSVGAAAITAVPCIDGSLESLAPDL